MCYIHYRPSTLLTRLVTSCFYKQLIYRPTEPVSIKYMISWDNSSNLQISSSQTVQEAFSRHLKTHHLDLFVKLSALKIASFILT